MLRDVAPLLKECQETLDSVKKTGNMEVACYIQGFINSINRLRENEDLLDKIEARLCDEFPCDITRTGDPDVCEFCESPACQIKEKISNVISRIREEG